MKHIITFPPNDGQLAGTHTFNTARELNAFLARMVQRGISIKNGVITRKR